MSFCDFHTMQTKSGRVFTPLTSDDVVEVIREDMGDEVADYIEEVISDTALEHDTAYTLLQDEFASYEADNEHWHSFVDDLSEEIEQLREKIEDNKLTKAKISIELYKIYEKMRKEL